MARTMIDEGMDTLARTLYDEDKDTVAITMYDEAIKSRTQWQEL